MKEIKKSVPFSKQEERYVEGVVYSPDQKDSEKQFMKSGSIEKMADRFMKLYSQGKAYIDLQHNNVAGTGYIKKCLIDDQGSWVVGVHVEDDSTWESIKKGDLNGFSIYGSGEIKSDGEIQNVQISKISVVDHPVNQQAFSVIKSEKTTKEKVLSFLEHLFKSEVTMENSVEERLTDLETSVSELKKNVNSLTGEKQGELEKSEKEGSDEVAGRLSEIEEIQKSLNQQISYLLGGGVSQSQPAKAVEEKQEENLFAFMI